MKHKSLVNSVSEKFSLKQGQSRKIVDHILIELLEAGLSGEGFSSPILRVTSKDLEAKVVESPEGAKNVPARRLMRLVKSKSYVGAGDKVMGSSPAEVTS